MRSIPIWTNPLPTNFFICTMNLHRSPETQLHAIDLCLEPQSDISILPIRIYKATGNAPSIRCYAPGVVVFRKEWPSATREHAGKCYLHINKERAGLFIESHDEASCGAEARYRMAENAALGGFEEVWRWLEGEGRGEESSSLGHGCGEKDLEDKEREMKKVAEGLARRRTEADGAARRRGESVGPYFSIYKQRAELSESKVVLGDKEQLGGSEQGLEQSRDIEAYGRNVLPQGHDPVAAPALASSNQGAWTNSKKGDASGGVSGILTLAWYYTTWRRRKSVSQTLAEYTFPGTAR